MSNKIKVSNILYTNRFESVIEIISPNLIRYISPVIIPNQLIYRNDPPRFIFFKESEIEKIRNKFHKEKKENLITINHSDELINCVKFIKDYLLSDNNRYYIEFDKLPNGTCIIEYEISNIDIIEKIKNGYLNGLSIEGYFYEKDVNSDIILLKYEKLHRHKLSNEYFIEINGGGNGTGRSEHGEPHFTLNGNNSVEIFIPEEIPVIKLKFKKGKLNSKKSKILIYFLNKDDNLKKIKELWNKINKYNINPNLKLFNL